MQPEPNEHGVYTEFTEHIHHVTESGAVLDIYLVELTNGWVCGLNYEMQWCGGGFYPSASGARHPTREAALDAAITRMKSSFSGPHYHDTSETETRQRQEALDWLRSQKQMELF